MACGAESSPTCVRLVRRRRVRSARRSNNVPTLVVLGTRSMKVLFTAAAMATPRSAVASPCRLLRPRRGQCPDGCVWCAADPLPDPYYGAQWYSRGGDPSAPQRRPVARSVLRAIPGSGVQILVNDNGVDNNHPDLAKLDTSSSCSSYAPSWQRRPRHGLRFFSPGLVQQ